MDKKNKKDTQKVIFLPIQAHMEYIFGIELEVIQRCIDKGQRPVLISCNGELPSCEANPYHKKSICASCIYRRKWALRFFEGNLDVVNLRSLLRKVDNQVVKNIRKAEKPRDLFNVQQGKNFDIGFGIASSMISRFRDHALNLDKRRALLDRMARAASMLYNGLTHYLSKNHISEVYNFNGRGFLNRALYRAAQANDVSYVSYERGSNKDKFAYFQNCLPHNYRFIYEEAMKAWESGDAKDRERIGASWFTERVAGKDQEWLNYTRDQVRGLLPERFTSGVRKIVIFNSSEDEFAAIGADYQNPVYEDQITGLDKIAKDLLNCEGVEVFLRMHPNLSGVKNTQTEHAYALASRNFTVVPPESKISTYDLMFNADVVLTFGSQAGIEAIYWGKPSVLVGRSRYCLFPGTYQPESHEEVLRMLTTPIESKGKVGALQFGYYFQTFGLKFKYFEPTGYNHGTFQGKRIPTGFADHFNEFYPTLSKVFAELRRLIGRLLFAEK